MKYIFLANPISACAFPLKTRVILSKLELVLYMFELVLDMFSDKDLIQSQLFPKLWRTVSCNIMSLCTFLVCTILVDQSFNYVLDCGHVFYIWF